MVLIIDKISSGSNRLTVSILELGHPDLDLTLSVSRFHGFFFLLNGDITLAAVSAALFGGSFMTAKILIQSYTPLESVSADEAVSSLPST